MSLFPMEQIGEKSRVKMLAQWRGCDELAYLLEEPEPSHAQETRKAKGGIYFVITILPRTGRKFWNGEISGKRILFRTTSVINM